MANSDLRFLKYFNEFILERWEHDLTPSEIVQRQVQNAAWETLGRSVERNYVYRYKDWHQDPPQGWSDTAADKPAWQINQLTYR